MIKILNVDELIEIRKKILKVNEKTSISNIYEKKKKNKQIIHDNKYYTY